VTLRVQFPYDRWHQKTAVAGLSRQVVCVMTYLVVLTEHWLVTDRQTDRHRALAYTAQA